MGALARSAARDHDAPVVGLSPGARLGEWELLGALGAGGMAAVFRARHLGSGAVHALKVLTETTGKRRERFEREARVLARLPAHPGVVRVHACGAGQGLAWFAMELVEGPTLERELGGGPLPWRRALELAQGIAEALAHVHAAGVVHRDLKPANVILRAGRPVLVDFGVARDEAEERLTLTRQMLGTPSYMAPEQAEGSRAVGPATDVFALGVVLHECLCGERPFSGETLAQLARALLQDEVRPLAPRVPGLPPVVDVLLRRALARSPEQRPGAGQVADALAAVLRGEATPLGRSSTAERVLRLARRRPGLAAVAGGLTLLGLTAVGSAWWLRVVAPRQAWAAEVQVALGEAERARLELARRARAWRLLEPERGPDPAALVGALRRLAELAGSDPGSDVQRQAAIGAARAAGEAGLRAALLPALPLPCELALGALGPTDDPETAAARAAVLLRAGRGAELAADPQGPAREELLLQRARAALRGGDPGPARALLAAPPPADEGLRRGRDRLQAELLRGEARDHAAAGRGDQARGALLAARALDPLRADQGSRRAARAVLPPTQAGELEVEAAAGVLAAIAQAGALPRAAGPVFLRAAVAANERGDLDRFGVWMARAQEVDREHPPEPALVNTWLLHARTLAVEGRTEEGLDALCRAIAWSDVDVLSKEELRRFGDEGWDELCVARRPEEWGPYAWRAGATLARLAPAGTPARAAQLESALADLERALAHPALPAQARGQLALRRLDVQRHIDPRGGLERALALWEQGVGDPRHVAGEIADALGELGRHDEAVDWLRKVLVLDVERIAQTREGRLPPGLLGISDGEHRVTRDTGFLIRGLAAARRFEEARQELERLRARNPAEEDLVDLEVHILQREGRRDEALALIDAALKRTPARSRELLRLRGVVLRQR